MKHKLMLLATALILFSACQQQTTKEVKLVVSNATDHDALGVVDGVPLKALLDSIGAPAGTPLTLSDEMGKHVATQIFNNGEIDLLLFESNTLANGESIYYVTIGQDSAQASVQPAVFTQVYPKRKDDLVWENESAIWRAYGPELQATGEQAYGYDIWCKNTKELCCDNRYRLALGNWAMADSLREIGEMAKADSISRAGNFHLDHGDGMDCYAVGPTLGGGTAALLDSLGRIAYPWAWKRHKILANGPLLAAIELEYDTLRVGRDSVVEHRTIVTQKGTRFTIINVRYDGLKKTHDIAVGIVYHGEPDSIRQSVDGKYIAYSDPTDQPANNSGRVLIGAYLPTLTRTSIEQGHILGIAPYSPGETFTYYMGSGWSKGDCPSLLEMTQELRQMSEPARTIRIVVD